MLDHLAYQLLSYFIVGCFCLWLGFDIGTHREREKKSKKLRGFAADVHHRIFAGRWPS